MAAKAKVRVAAEEDELSESAAPQSAGEIAMLLPRHSIVRSFRFASLFVFRPSNFVLLFAFCFLLSTFTHPAFAQTKIIAGPMVGHVSDASARLWMQLNTTEDVSVRVVDRVSNRPVGGVRLGVEGPPPFIFDAPLAGLSPNHSYRIEVLFDDKPVQLPEPELIIRTPPAPGEPADFSIAFGSCISPAVNSRLAILQTAQALHPRAFLMLGNAGYLPADLKDWPVTRKQAATLLYQFYQNVRTTPDLQPLLRTTPMYAAWGEHDFGITGADRTFPFAQESRAAFMRFWPNPDYGSPESPGNFCSFGIGDVDFFLLDGRSFRDPPGDAQHQAFFGHDQLEWLKAQLAASRATFKVIAAAEQLLPDYPDGQGWGSYGPERGNFLPWLFENHITGVVLATGGRRLGELSLRPADAKNPLEYPLYEIASAPLGVDAADEKTQRQANPLRQGPLVSVQNFGTLDFGGPRGKRHITLRLRAADGKVLLEKVLFAGELAGQ